MWQSLGGHFSAYHIPYIHCITKSCSLCKFLDLVAFHFHCSYLWLGPLNCSPSFMPLVVPSLCCYHNHLWKMHVYPFHTFRCQADQVHTPEPGSQGSFLLVQSRFLLFLSALLQSPQVWLCSVTGFRALCLCLCSSPIVWGYSSFSIFTWPTYICPALFSPGITFSEALTFTLSHPRLPMLISYRNY